MPHGAESWMRDFASSVSFTGSKEKFHIRLVGYMILEEVTLDFATGVFKKVTVMCLSGPPIGWMDPTILQFLED